MNYESLVQKLKKMHRDRGKNNLDPDTFLMVIQALRTSLSPSGLHDRELRLHIMDMEKSLIQERQRRECTIEFLEHELQRLKNHA